MAGQGLTTSFDLALTDIEKNNDFGLPKDLEQKIMQVETRAKQRKQSLDLPIQSFDSANAGTVKGAIPFQSDFFSAAQKYNVPVNVLMGLADQESRFNPTALGSQTQWGRAKGLMQYLDSTAANMGINPYNPTQSIDAAARQLRERLDKGYSMIDAVREHFAGPDRKKWGSKTQAYGNEVMQRAARFGNVALPQDSQAAAQPQKATTDATDSGRYRQLSETEMKRMQDAIANGQDTFVPFAGAQPVKINIPKSELDKQKAQQEADKGILSDTGNLLLSGINSTAEGLRELTSRIPGVRNLVGAVDKIDEYFTGKNSQQLFDEARQKYDKKLTTGTQEARKKLWVVEPGDKLADGTIAKSWDFGEAWKDPRAYYAGIVESVPEMVVTMGGSMTLARGAFTQALKAGATREIAAKKAATTATIAGGLLEGGFGGAHAAVDVRKEINGMSADLLKNSDVMKSLMAEGKSFEQARRQVANDAATKAFVLAGVGTGIFGGMGDRALAKVITEGSKTRLKSAVAGAVGEGLLEEMPQSALQQMGQNYAMQDADPNTPLMKGVANQAAGGAVLGGIMGGGLGAAGHRSSVIEAPEQAAAADPAQQPSADVNPAASTDIGAAEPVAQPVRRGPIETAMQGSLDAQVDQELNAINGDQPAPSAAEQWLGEPGTVAQITPKQDPESVYTVTVEGYQNGEVFARDQEGSPMQFSQNEVNVAQVQAPTVEHTPSEKGRKTDLVTWDNIQPNQQVTLYRGESAANDQNGQWWTTKRDKAERYGDVQEVTLNSDLIGRHAVRGHNGADEFVFTSPEYRPNQLAKQQDATTQPEPAKAEKIEIEQPSAQPAPKQTAPVKPVELSLSDMTEAELRDRIKYLAQQAKTNGGWDKRLMNERRKVEAEIGRKGRENTPSIDDMINGSNQWDSMKPAQRIQVAKKAGISNDVAKDLSTKAWGYLDQNSLEKLALSMRQVKPVEVTAPKAEPKAKPEESAPVATEQAAPSEAPSVSSDFAEQLINAHVNDPSAKPRIIQAEIERSGRARAQVFADVSRIINEYEAGQTAPVSTPAAPAPRAKDKRDPSVGADGQPKWFMSQDKAQAFIDKKNLGDTHEAVKVNNRRYEIRPKDQANAEQRVANTATNDLKTKQPKSIVGKDLGDGWSEFTADSGTINIPRSEMPQIKAEHRGAMVNFMNARGIAHREETVPASSLKPTQSEFSREKVEKAKQFEGGNRSILVSSDNHVLDGHHQWMAALEDGQDVRIIRLDAPIRDLVKTAHEFPSSTTQDGQTQPQPKAKAEPSANTLVTDDRAAELRARLKAKLNQLNSGIDPEMLAIGAELAVYHIERGARTFAAFAKNIAADLDVSMDKVRPYLRSWYNGARDMMEDMGGTIDGMDDAATVRAELAKLDAVEQPAPAAQTAAAETGGTTWTKAADQKMWTGSNGMVIVDETFDRKGDKITAFNIYRNQAEQAQGNYLATKETLKKAQAYADSLPTTNEGMTDVSSTEQRVEPDRGNTAATESVVSDTDGNATGTNDAGTGRTGTSTRVEPGTGQRNQRVSADGTTSGRATGDQRVYQSNGEFEPTQRTAGGAERSGSRVDSEQGQSTERARTDAVIKDAHSNGASELAQRLSAQKKADKTATKWGDKASIDAALPLLLPEQRDDVFKAETRFDGNNGILFTNGTGTGKTATGMGIAKRFINAGKDNVLIVVPSDKIASDWVKFGKMLNVDVKQLDGVADNGGTGPVVTTYANFGQNDSLAQRDWDLIVPDESHYLSSNENGDSTAALDQLRGLTGHHAGFYNWVRRRHADQWAKYEQASNALRDAQKSDKNYAQLEANEEQARKEWGDFERAEREKWDSRWSKQQDLPKVAMLSATPFAYVKNTDYAEGYLFHYVEPADREKRQGEGSAYNSGDPRDQFMMQNFGYRMRYNKLTAPESGVNAQLLEQQFNEQLKKTGALSGRKLEVPFDYDRKFVLVNDAVGTKIDNALKYLREESLNAEKRARESNGEQSAMTEAEHWKELFTSVDKRFDYQNRMYLLESIKAKAAVPFIRQNLKLGRKVVVFHDFNQGGAMDPFKAAILSAKTPEQRDFNQRVMNQRADLFMLDLSDLQSPIETLTKAFPDALLFNGTVSKGKRRANADRFNNDDGKNNLIIVQSDAGREGVSLHDTTGKHQRVEVNLGMPTKPVAATQIEGRIYRTGQASDAVFRYLTTGTAWEASAFATKIAERASTAENLALGSEARGLKDAFIDAYQNADAYAPNLNEGKGGKDYDRNLSASNTLSAFEKSKTFYWAQQKNTKSRQGREGADYYATPEPVGFKMVEFADIKPGEKVLEPSAGHGAIARFFPEQADTTMIEPSYDLSQRAGLANGNARIINDQFESLHVNNKYDAIVMNPPYGNGGKISTDHLAKAATHLREGGRIVALLPRGGMADSRLNQFLNSEQAADLYQVARVNMPSSTFERAGTAVNTQIVVLEKHKNKADAAGIQQRNVDLSDAKTVNELFDRLENVSFDARKPSTTPEPTQDIIEHTNDFGNTIRGTILTGIKKYEAQEIDPYTFRKNTEDGKQGWFIREKYLSKIPKDQNFSRADAPATGSTRDQVRTALSDRFGSAAVDKLMKDGVLTIADTYTDPGVEGFTVGNRVTLVADTLTPDAIIPTFLHELGGHVGMQGTMKPETYAQLIQQFDRMVTAKDPLALEAKRLAERETSPSTQQVEYLPYLITVAARADQKSAGIRNFINRIVSAVKAWAVDRLGMDINLNARDVLALAERMVNAVSNTVMSKSEQRYSRNDSYAGMSTSDFADLLRNDFDGLKLSLTGSGKVVTLSRIVIPDASRNRGTGTQVMQRITDWADQNGRTVALSPSGDFGGNKSRLNDFYKRFGFVDNKGRNKNYEISETMYREPGQRYSREDQTNSEAFKRWFGDSQVVDENGQPLVVYHGTGAEFTEFDPDLTGTATDAGTEGKGFYFTSDWDSAKSNADYVTGFGEREGAKVMAVYLAIENPYKVNRNNAPRGLESSPKEAAKFTKNLIKQGYDGVEYTLMNGSKNYVAFYPEQIKSATDNVGTFDANNPDIRFSRRDEDLAPVSEEEYASRLNNWSDRLKNLPSDSMNNAMQSGLRFIPLRPMLTEMAKDIPAAQSYLKIKDAMDALRNKWHSKTDAVAQQWLKYRVKNAAENKQLMDIIHESTLMQVDPSKEFESLLSTRDRIALREMPADHPNRKKLEEKQDKDEARKVAHERLSREFDKISPEGKEIYTTVRDAYSDLADAFDQTLLNNMEKAINVRIRKAEREYKREVERITDEGLQGEDRQNAMRDAERRLKNAKTKIAWNRKARMTQLRQQFETNRLVGPYFPLARFGEFFVTVRDKKTGEVVSFSRFEKAHEQRRFYESVKNDPQFNVERGVLNDTISVRKAVDPNFVADVEDILADLPNADTVKDEVWQRYLDSLPDFSIRKNRIHRKGRAGYDSDAVRAFGSHMFHGSHQLARLTHSMDLEDALDQARDEAREAKDPVRSGLIVNEMEKRHDFVMSPTGGSLAQWASTFAFVWYLAGSPKAAIANLFQTPIMGVPILGAYGGGINGIAQASKQLTGALVDFTKGKGFAERSANLTPDERLAMSQGYERGIIERTQGHDLAGVGETGVEYNAAREKVMKVISWGFHHTERLNREVTFLAAYRMARKKGLTHDAALDKAGELTWKTHFDYSNTSRPRLMHSDVMKILLVFRNFQINMLYRLFRDVHQAVTGESKEVRREALTQLAGITGMMMLNAGITGTWLFGIAMVMAGLFGDEGDDPEEELKKSMVNVLGPRLAGLALHGVPGYVTGTALSESVGMPDLWFRSPSSEKEGEEALQYWQSQLLGAVPSIGAQFVRGASQFGKGEEYRGIETMMPKMLKDPMKAYRYATDGAKNMRGDTVTDVETSDVFKQALGFTPARISEQYRTNNASYNKQQSIMKARKGIMDDYYKAANEEDEAKLDKLITKIEKFNEENPEQAITARSLSQSRKNRDKGAENAVGGMRYNNKLRQMLLDEQAPSIYK